MISYVVASKNEVLHKSSHSYVRSTVFAQFCDFDEFVMSYRPQVEGGGVFLETEKLLPISQIVSIEFSFADSDIIFLKGEGEILSHSAQTEAVGPGIVIRFLNLDDKSKVLLSKLSNQYL
ncbi:MAG: hypothetical protein HYS98_03385 [Deltaproteobacteria bacterium]|nr:hypothetical protein [Deltaproteobacteria bacterium]